MAETAKLLRDKHVKYLKRILQIVPGQYSSLDTHRMTMAFFAISGLDLLGALDEIESERLDIIKWIYSLQVLPNYAGTNISQCGFRGSSSLGNQFDVQQCRIKSLPCDSGHVAMTYTALASLLVLGDNLAYVDKSTILEGLRGLQQLDGSFSCVPEGSETDMRFVYCAACISYMLDDWSGIDTQKVMDYIMKSVSYEGAMGQGPGTEAHVEETISFNGEEKLAMLELLRKGGPTFCAVATLYLMGKMESALSPHQLERLKRWCMLRQESGFQGRPNKPVDTCYSFWVGATLQLLGVLDLSDFLFNRSFVLSTQSPVTGGLAKWPDSFPDPLHTYLGLCGLSLIGEPGLASIHPALNITQRAVDHLDDLHRKWQQES